MKFIQKKIIGGHEYYYFECPFRVHGKRRLFTKFLGKELPANLPEILRGYFGEMAQTAGENMDPDEKKFFSPKSVLPIEQARFWHQGLHMEIFEKDLRLLRSLFGVLFLLNSNRAEGSKVTRKDIEKIIQRKRKPKTLMDIEVMNSLAALRFAFSHRMRWNFASLKKIHFFLFDRISPEIAGKFKKENNVINNEPTADFHQVKNQLRELFHWFWAHRKTAYPPRLALEFHYRFEAIHPFVDGNGRIGRLLFNAFLLQRGYMPVIFFSENHAAYCTAISQARAGRKGKLAHYFIEQLEKTRTAVERYKAEGILRGGSPQIGQWEIEKGKIRKY